MNILIVEDCIEVAKLWQRALERDGAVVARSQSVTEAIYQIQSQCFDVIVTNLICDGVPTMPVADYAAYRSPKSQVIFVTNTSFFQTAQSLGSARMRRVFCKEIRRQKIWRRSRNTMRRVCPTYRGCAAPNNPAQGSSE